MILADAAGKVVGAVCHGPGGLVDATAPDGKSIFDGKHVTGFSNTEEEAVGKTDRVPFLLENRLKALGGNFEKNADWTDFSIADGRLVTGKVQNVCLKALAHIQLAVLYTYGQTVAAMQLLHFCKATSSLTRPLHHIVW